MDDNAQMLVHPDTYANMARALIEPDDGSVQRFCGRPIWDGDDAVYREPIDRATLLSGLSTKLTDRFTPITRTRIMITYGKKKGGKTGGCK